MTQQEVFEMAVKFCEVEATGEWFTLHRQTLRDTIDLAYSAGAFARTAEMLERIDLNPQEVT